MAGIIAAFSWLWVLMTMTANARVINKRAAFYIANDTMCIVDGEVYLNGDPVPTDDHCEKCTCRPPGFSCVLRDCEVKPGCKAVRKDGECCPDYICGCSHNGNVYKDGDFIRDLQNPCYTCRCHGSSISCTFADCLFRSDCGPEYIQGECCPRYDHCPPLSTTQRTTTVITTVPITYDETTMALFNLTSSPHERLATHTTIFPTAGTISMEGEGETTVTYGTQEHRTSTLESVQTTHVHDHTLDPSQESSEGHASQVDTSTITTFDSKETIKESSDVSQETSGTADDVSTTSTAGDATVSEVHVSKVDSSTVTTFDSKEITKVSSEASQVSSETTADDASRTATASDATASEADAEEGDELKDSISTSAFENLIPDDHSIAQRPDDDQTDHTLVEPDEISSFQSSTEEISSSTSDIPEEKETFNTVAGSKDDILVTVTDLTTTKGDDKITLEEGEEDVHSSHKTVSSVTELGGTSERTTHSSLSEATMSGDANTELFPFTPFTTPEAHDTTLYEHGDAEASESPFPAVTSHEDSQTKSETGDKEIFDSTGHSDFDYSVPSTTGSEIESHSFSTGVMDDDGQHPSDGFMDEGEIFTQDAEELESFPEETTSSYVVTHSESTALDNSSRLPSSGESDPEDETTAFTEDHPVTETEANVHAEKTESSDYSESDTTTADDHSHTQLTTDKLTNDQSTYDDFSAHFQTEKTVTGDGNEENVSDSLLSSLFTDTETEKNFSAPQSTTELLDDDHTLSESEAHAAEVNTTLSAFEDHEPSEVLPGIINTSSVTDDINITGEEINTETEDVAQSTSLVTSEATTESVITMEAEIDSFFMTDESSSRMSSASDVSTISVKDTESYERLHTSTESLTTMHNSETPVAFASSSATSPDVSLFSNHQSTAQNTVEDHLSTKSEEHEILSETSYLSSTIPPQQETSDFQQTDDFPPNDTTEILSQDNDHTGKNTEADSTQFDTDKYVSTETSTSRTSDHISEDVVTVSPSEESNDPDRYTTGSEQGGTSEKEATDDIKLMETGSQDDSTLFSTVIMSDNLSKAEEMPDEQRGGNSEDEINDHFQGTTEKQTTEITMDVRESIENHEVVPDYLSTTGNVDKNSLSTTQDHVSLSSEDSAGMATESTMDAEESTVSHGSEITTDYFSTIEKVKKNFISTIHHVSLNNEEGDSSAYYTLDGEIFSASGGDHMRVSRSTSSNNMDSSATAEYPEEPESQHRYTSKAETQNTETLENNGTSISAFDSSPVTKIPSDSVTESLHTEATTLKVNTLDPTHHTYTNFAEISRPSSDVDYSQGDEHAENQTADEITETNLADTNSNVNKTEEGISEGASKIEKLSHALTTEILRSTEAASDLLEDKDISPDIISLVEHHANSISSYFETTEKPTPTDSSVGVTQSRFTSLGTNLFSESTGDISTFEKDETHAVTESEYSSQNIHTNSTTQREGENDAVFRFSRTSERYATGEEAPDGNDLIDSSTESQPTVSSFTMDAEIIDLYHITEKNYGETEKQSTDASLVNTQLSSEQTTGFENEKVQDPNPSEPEKEFVGKDFDSGPEKGGEWFEPTVPVLSIINVHRGEKTETTADVLTTSKYFTAANLKTSFSPESEEMSSSTGKTDDQTHYSSNDAHLYHSSSTIPDVRDSSNSAGGVNVDTEISWEVQHTTIIPDEVARPDDPDYLWNRTDADESSYASAQEIDQETNDPSGNGYRTEGSTVSAKLTYHGEETTQSSTETTNVVAGTEKGEESVHVEAKEVTLQTTDDVVDHKYEAEQQTHEESVLETTVERNFSTDRDEMESDATNDIKHTDDITKNDDLEESPETEDAEHFPSGTEKASNETTKEPSGDTSVEYMLSDGALVSRDFADIITEDAEPTIDEVSITEPIAVEGEEQSLQNNDSMEETHLDPEREITDESYLQEKNSEEKYVSQEHNITNVSSNVITESGPSEDLIRDSGLFLEERNKSSVSNGDYNEGPNHESDDDQPAESTSTYIHSISTTPLPILLSQQLTEKLKEDFATDQNLDLGKEEYSTVQPDAISDATESESVSSVNLNEDSEKRAVNLDTTATDKLESSTTIQSDVNEYNSFSTSIADHEDKKVEVDTVSFPPEEKTSLSSNSTEIIKQLYSDNSINESEENSEATNYQVTEKTQKQKKNTTRVFVLRVSHDDDPSDNKNIPKEKEESAVLKNGENYSVRSSAIVVDSPDDVTEEERDRIAGPTEATQVTQEDSDDKHFSDQHETTLDHSSTILSTVKEISGVVLAQTSVTTTESQSDDTLRSQYTEDIQISDGGHLKDEHDDIFGLKSTVNPLNNVTA